MLSHDWRPRSFICASVHFIMDKWRPAGTFTFIQPEIVFLIRKTGFRSQRSSVKYYLMHPEDCCLFLFALNKQENALFIFTQNKCCSRNLGDPELSGKQVRFKRCWFPDMKLLRLEKEMKLNKNNKNKQQRLFTAWLSLCQRTRKQPLDSGHWMN